MLETGDLMVGDLEKLTWKRYEERVTVLETVRHQSGFCIVRVAIFQCCGQ